MRKLTNEELERKSVEEFRAAEKTPVLFILDNVRSMNNVGSVFRTADAFLFEGIILCGFTPVPPHREIQKTALGATETVSWKYMNSAAEAVEQLRKEGWKVFAVEQAEKSIRLDRFIPEKNAKTAIVLGHEVNGVSQEVIDRCDGVIEVPQAGTKHSLNISVCAGIVAWELFSQLHS